LKSTIANEKRQTEQTAGGSRWQNIAPKTPRQSGSCRYWNKIAPAAIGEFGVLTVRPAELT
jgi:hypothetical protein